MESLVSKSRLFTSFSYMSGIDLVYQCILHIIEDCACAGNTGNIYPALRVSDPDMHHGTCVTHVPWSLTSVFRWSRWHGNRSRHSRRMQNPQFYVSGKRHIGHVLTRIRIWILHKYPSRLQSVGNQRNISISKGSHVCELIQWIDPLLNAVALLGKVTPDTITQTIQS